MVLTCNDKINSAGGGLPTGGTTGQVLAKKSNTDGDVQWVNDAKVTVTNNLTSTSTTAALSANQGKVLNDSKQATLVSGTNIKTINNNSILGSGNISISFVSTKATTTSITGTLPSL